MNARTNENGATTDDATQAAIQAVTIDQVARVYSGRPGCGCGCRGKYYPEDRKGVKPTAADRAMITKVLRTIQADPAAKMEDGILSSEGSRYFWAYLKSGESNR